MKASPERLSEAIGYRFSNPRFVEQAVTHRSAGGSNNERLEFLGDAILGFVIADELCRVFADATEGQLSRLRAALVKRESLAALARSLELGDYLNLGAGELRSGGQSRDSILADALEAVFAAVYLDSGYPSAPEVILNLFQARLTALTLESQQKDPKTRLQEYLQGLKHPVPEYRIVEVSGDQHAQQFRVACAVPELGMEVLGTGSSRRRAEQDAAAAVLKALNLS